MYMVFMKLYTEYGQKFNLVKILGCATSVVTCGYRYSVIHVLKSNDWVGFSDLALLSIVNLVVSMLGFIVKDSAVVYCVIILMAL